MAMRLWSCANCSQDEPSDHDPAKEVRPHKGFAFTAEKPEGRYAPVCPKCGLDGGDPAGRDWIAPLVVTHFEPPHPAGVRGKGAGAVACTGKPRAGKVQVTAHPQVVSCPACRATAAFKAALARIAGGEEFDLPDAPAAPATLEG